MHHVVEQVVDGLEQVLEGCDARVVADPLYPTQNHIKIIFQLGVHQELYLLAVEHKIAALDVFYLFEDEGDQANYELVNELLLLLHLWHRILHIVTDFLEDEVVVVVQQAEFEFRFRRPLE